MKVMKGMIKMYLIMILCYFVFIFLIIIRSQCPAGYLFDFPSILCLFVVLIPVVLGTGTGKDLKNAISIGCSRKKTYSLIELKRAKEAVGLIMKISFLTGGLIALLEFLILLHKLNEPSQIGPLCAIILLILLYALFLAMIFLPLNVIINNRIISYMDETEDQPVQSEDRAQRIYYRLRSFGLTDREAEVARLISLGMSNKEIGKELFITETTVKKHVTHIFDKMKLENREELIKMIKEI
ncbi:MAG: helix-turn-helix transcriptional regulator [Thermoflexaceae bacterium]|nr:helix-turn-helix transcriptional regulator [Thermoflexaceae bacterium]